MNLIIKKNQDMPLLNLKCTIYFLNLIYNVKISKYYMLAGYHSYGESFQLRFMILIDLHFFNQHSISILFILTKILILKLPTNAIDIDYNQQ